MAELPDKSPGEIIDSAHINDIAARSIQRYADAAERDLLNPTPVSGQLAYLEYTSQTQVYDGTVWALIGGGEFLPLSGGVLTGPLIQVPDGAIAAAAAGGVIQRWQGDGDAGTNRRYEWRRGAQFGQLTLWSINAIGTESEVLVVSDDGSARVASPFGTGNDGQYTIRNISYGTVDPGGGDGIDGDMFVNIVAAPLRVLLKRDGVWLG